MQKFAHIQDLHRRIFAAMLAHLDESVGKVLAKLRESGVEENTLVVFLSDNGGPTKELTSCNAPLRGGKGELLEGGIRVPFVVSWKSRIAAGQVIDVPITSMDATATVMEIIGTEAGRLKLDGNSLLSLLTGKTTEMPERPLFWRVGKKNALRRGDWKLIRNENKWQLYDLAHDIGEATDLAGKQPALLQQLSALWDQWSAEQIEPLWH